MKTRFILNTLIFSYIVCITTFVAQAQTRIQAQATIDSLFPDNNTRAITPAKLRYGFSKTLDFYVPSNIPLNSIGVNKLSTTGASNGQAIVNVAGVPTWVTLASGGTIGGITGLSDSLAKKVNLTYLNTVLSLKQNTIGAGGLGLDRISLTGSTNGYVLKNVGGVLSWATDNAGGSTVTGLTTVTNIATLRTTVGTAGQMVQTTGYYTANDGGGWAYIWNATSTATDDGGSVIAVTGQSTGRWEQMYIGFVQARTFGIKADGATDDLIPLSNACKYAIVKQTRLYLGAGVIAISNPLVLGTVSPATLPSAERFMLIGEGKTFDPNTTSPLFTTGTMILLKGTGKTAVISLQAGLGRNFKMQDFTVSCETLGGATNGILWATTAFSAHILENVESYRANRCFAIEAGGYANGEFIYFENCKGNGVVNFFYQATNTGQAFNPIFVNCHGSVSDGGSIFELGGGGLGFGLTATNFNSSNPIYSNFATGTGVTFIKTLGISGIITFEGGRVEQVSTIVNNVQGTNNINGKIVIKGMHFDGLQSSDTRNFIATSASNSAFSLQFEHCIFSPITANINNTAVNVIWNNYNESECRFFKCNFTRFPRYYVSIAETTKTRVFFEDCEKDNVQIGGKIRFNKHYGYNYPTLASATHKPQNFLLQSGFTSSFGGVAATSPWVMGVNSTFDNIQGQAGHTGGYSTDSRFRQFALKANSNVCQTISAFNFGSGANDYNYRAYVSLHNGVNSPFRIELVNSVSGIVYDRFDFKGANSNGDMLKVDLHAHDASSGGGNVKVCLVNRNTDWPMNVNLYGQHAFTNPSASYVETTTTAVDSPFVIR